MTSIIRWALSSSKSETLSGAIDVIVVEQPKGELQSSPFHVRFGKVELLRGEIVHIRVNGVEVPLKMRLGSAGEAFFVERASPRRRRSRDAPTHEPVLAAAAAAAAGDDDDDKISASEEVKLEVALAEVPPSSEATLPSSTSATTTAPSAVEEEDAEGEDKKKDLSLVLPKWYTNRASDYEDEESSDQEALVAALEWREQQQARKLEERAASENASTKTDDEDECSIGAVDFEDQKDEESHQLSWIWNFGSLPKKLLAPLVRGRKDDVEVVKDLLEEIVARVVAENEQENTGFRGFRSLLWNRKSRQAASSPQPESRKEEATPEEEGKEAASSDAAPNILGEEVDDVVSTKEETESSAAAAPCELFMKLDDDREEIVTEASFASDAQNILADPRLRVRIFGVEKSLSEALPALIAKAAFDKEPAAASRADGDSSVDDEPPAEESGEGVATDISKIIDNTCSVPSTAETEVEEVSAGPPSPSPSRANNDGKGEIQRRFSQMQLKDILNFSTPEQQNLAAEIVAAAAEEHERGFELGSSDNLAALVALDQVNPELSSGSLAALIHNNSDTIKAAFEDMRRRHNSADSIGFPIDDRGNSSTTLSDAYGEDRVEGEEAGAILEEGEDDNDSTSDVVENGDEAPSMDAQDDAEEVASQKKKKGYPYRKTLRPSARQIASLSLKRGANVVEFYVRSPKGGEHVVSSTVYLWSRYARCVFAEIDGVIASGRLSTSSRGRRGGKQPANHDKGAAELFTNIARNGYSIVYVTTQVIGTASGNSTTTRESLEQLWTQEFGDLGLPRAPVLVAPGSLLDSAFHSETRFKTAALTNVLKLFPDRNPLWAALARHQDDVKPYLDAGVPRFRVFRVFGECEKEVNRNQINSGIDQRGALVSSYARLNSLIHQIFPAFQNDNNAPRSGSRESTTARPLRDAQDDRYNDLNFWKLPLSATPPKLPLAPRQSSDNETLSERSLRSRSKSPDGEKDSSSAISRQQQVSPSPPTNERASSPSLSPTNITRSHDSRELVVDEAISETTLAASEISEKKISSS